ncbi:MAG: hypothetical protein U1E60_04440 [Reyranellaceae bacterium]
MGLIADRLEACDALLQRWIVEIGNAGIDGVIEPLQAQVGSSRPLVQLGDVFASAPDALIPLGFQPRGRARDDVAHFRC